MSAVTNRISTVPGRSIVAYLPQFRAALEQQRAFRAEQLAELAAQAARGASNISDDPRDEVTDVLRTGATAALVEIEAAIARMVAGTYGACEYCKNSIPVERLEILPMAALCMRCAHAHERRTR